MITAAVSPAVLRRSVLCPLFWSSVLDPCLAVLSSVPLCSVVLCCVPLCAASISTAALSAALRSVAFCYLHGSVAAMVHPLRQLPSCVASNGWQAMLLT